MSPIKIIAPHRYPWTFAGPTTSRNEISRRFFIPANKISEKIEGVTLFPATIYRKFQLIHAFNRIPIGTTPYVLGCEAHIPRGFGLENSIFYRLMSQSIASKRCRALVPISKFAEGLIRRDHEGKPWAQAIFKKMTVNYPSIRLRTFAGTLDMAPIKIAFVGNHFARKGGCVAVEMAKRAKRRGLPLEVHIVSGLEMGGGVWTDPTREEFFEAYRRPANWPNVYWHPSLPNREVLELLAGMHFSVLATFSDTFGYSALESMACGTPVIATRQGALPEFICDGENGVLLDLPVNAWGEWIHGGRTDRHTPAYEALFQGEIERLASEALTAVERYTADEKAYQRMRQAAYRKIETDFSTERSSRFWDDVYEKAVRPVS